MLRQLSLQTPLQGLLEQGRQQPVGARQPHLTRVDPLEQPVQATRGNKILNHAPPTSRTSLLISHSHQSFKEGLHRPLNTPPVRKP